MITYTVHIHPGQSVDMRPLTRKRGIRQVLVCKGYHIIIHTGLNKNGDKPGEPVIHLRGTVGIGDALYRGKHNIELSNAGIFLKEML